MEKTAKLLLIAFTCFALQGCCLHNHCLPHRGNDDNPRLCQIRMVPCPFQKQHGMEFRII